ncbi:hypothetical protein CEXT_770621 [Caerostris extrusa]|uniref:Uncharacterized protein n=1 Tax=Caerostris extrusa TaxID=172846 RepID=A0AAV4TPN2_CAEEX|nr:hypothetical protein CEXT_770621 [Caerostris extrusa]
MKKKIRGKLKIEKKNCQWSEVCGKSGDLGASTQTQKSISKQTTGFRQDEKEQNAPIGKEPFPPSPMQTAQPSSYVCRVLYLTFAFLNVHLLKNASLWEILGMEMVLCSIIGAKIMSRSMEITVSGSEISVITPS